MIHIIDKRHVSRICKELHTTVKILNKKNFQTWYQTNRYFRKNEMLNKHYSSEKCSLNGIQEYITNSSAEWLNLKKNWQYQMVVRIWSKLNSYITDGNILWNSHFGKLFANLKPNHIYMFYDPEFPHQSTYSREMSPKIRHETYLRIFIAALFIVIPNWKQPKCLTEEWIYKFWYIHIMEYYST